MNGDGLAPGAWVHRRYEVLALVGRGGLGTTFRVRDHLFDRVLALKLVRAPTASRLALFRDEFERLSGLSHPCLASVHDLGRLRLDNGVVTAFFTSDWIDGVDLGAFARGRTLREACAPLCDALCALAQLHRAGLRHGDIKPDNVLVRASGAGVLIDLSASAPSEARSAPVSGTPGFMAPELATGGGDHRADLYGVGATLRALAALTSDRPDRGLRELIERLTQPDPARRPTDVDEVLLALGVEHPQVATSAPRPVRLLEREGQLAVIGEAIGLHREGRPGPRAIAIVGDEGLGRSRLLREAKWLAQQSGLVVEGHPGCADPVRDLLERACGEPLEAGPSAALAGLDRLRGRGERIALVLDDVDTMSEIGRRQWHALAAALGPGDGVLVLWTTTPAAPPPEAARMVALDPLSSTAVAAWAGDLVPPTRLAALMAASEGRPAEVAALLEQLASRAISESDLERDPALAMAAHRSRALAGLSEGARRALALLATADLPLEGDERAGLDSEALGELAAGRFVRRVEAGWTLARRSERQAIAAQLDSKTLEAAHRQHAESWLARVGDGAATRALAVARAVEHLALAGDPRAEPTARAHVGQSAHRPEAWARAAEALAGRAQAPEAQLWAAELCLRSGRHKPALDCLRRAFAARPSLRRDAAALRIVGQAWLEQGASARALRWLTHAARLDPSPAVLASLARVHNVLSAYTEALAAAERGLAGSPPPDVRAELLEHAGIAESYLGKSDRARRRLEQAAVLHAASGHPRGQLRALAFRAFVELRAGDAVAAVEGYRQALAVAEAHDFRARLVNLAVSLGAALHQLGRWGEALSHYERGLRTAIVLGERGPEVMLGFNIAKLHADIGLFDRARWAAERVAALASQHGMPFFAAAALAVKGEVAAAEGRCDAAMEAFERAAAMFETEGAQREQLEARLQWADACVAAGRHDHARQAADALSAASSALGAPDVEARRLMVAGRAELARDAVRARELLERARELAERADQRALRAEIGAELANLWAASGGLQLAHDLAAEARAHWERIALDLPEAYRKAFWAHPLRRALRTPAAAPVGPPTSPALVEKLHRLIEINKKLGASLEVDEVLRVAMDAAIELTAAERGFVILRGRDAKLTVAVARNIDRQQLGGRALKFSHSVADRVIESAEAVITVDAAHDERFSDNESVHLMRLKSIACVPIRGGEGVLGAMYLDNRFRPGAFDQDDLEILLAFSDQVAIALTNARLHAELERKTRELMAERKRVEQLLKNQAAEIDRLAEEVREKQTVLEHRYDYSAIVGGSARMHQVLAALDRVIATNVTVLIQGESGTGKELIARAIHFNGPRKDRPFVTVNCGAVPGPLLESELFGHLRGAFTGADRDREGLFVAARGGTLFLDEIAEMPLDMQVKLLRVLQEREVRPLGSTHLVPVDVRVVCATNRILRDEVAAGRFREDLFYRIGVVDIEVPPLRERREDIPALAAHLLERACRAQQRNPCTLQPAAMRRLLAHSWPGNARELENVLTNALVMSSGDAIGPDAIQLPDARLTTRSAAARSRAEYQSDERQRIAQALASHGWNVSEVARLLGIPRSSLYRKLKRYGLSAAT